MRPRASTQTRSASVSGFEVMRWSAPPRSLRHQHPPDRRPQALPAAGMDVHAHGRASCCRGTAGAAPAQRQRELHALPLAAGQQFAVGPREQVLRCRRRWRSRPSRCAGCPGSRMAAWRISCPPAGSAAGRHPATSPTWRRRRMSCGSPPNSSWPAGIGAQQAQQQPIAVVLRRRRWGPAGGSSPPRTPGPPRPAPQRAP